MMSTKCDRCTEIEQAFSRNGLFDTMQFLPVGEFCHSEGLSGERTISAMQFMASRFVMWPISRNMSRRCPTFEVYYTEIK